MIPKEKAIELVGKMCLNDCTDKNIKLTKKYALVAVDEIMDILDKEGYYEDDNKMRYWEEVKQEIEKL